MKMEKLKRQQIANIIKFIAKFILPALAGWFEGDTKTLSTLIINLLNLFS